MAEARRVRWAALLKGMNIGGKRMPMPELKAHIEAMGFTDVRTLLASGNVVFDADERDAAALEGQIEAMLAANGLSVSVLVRNAADLAAVIAANPYPDVARDRPAQLIVTFHRYDFPAELLAAFSERYDGPERLTACGRELYADYPEGQGQSKLPEMMVKALFPKVATARNWNTVVKLADLLG